MAAPIAQMFLAVQALAGPLATNQFKQQEFIIGTSLPDIRHLKVNVSNISHKNISLKDIQNQSDSFKAGILFHSYVNDKRDEFIKKHKIYKRLLSRTRHKQHCLKFAEDKILAKTFKTSPFIKYFNKILPQEKQLGISVHNIKKWHKIIQAYLSEGPIKSNLYTLLSIARPNMPFYKRMAMQVGTTWMASTIYNLAKNKAIQTKTLEFYNNLIFTL